MARTNRAEEKRQRRKNRVPLGGIRRKMSFDNQEEGYVYRWVNDNRLRLTEAQEAGYEFVDASGGSVGDPDVANEGGQSIDSRTGKNVGVKEDGSPLRAYLMRIKKDWYEEDQAEKQARVDDLETAIASGADEHATRIDKRYIPGGGSKAVQIERE